MNKINFKEFSMFSDITHKNITKIDVREAFADLIYKTANGVLAHNLAFAIFNSNGEIEVDEKEVEIMSNTLKLCTPQFQDSFNHNLHKDDKERDFKWD